MLGMEWTTNAQGMGSCLGGGARAGAQFGYVLMTMRVNLGIHPNDEMGYGRMGLRIAEALSDYGVVNYGGIHRQALGTETPNMCNEQAASVAPVALWVTTPPHVKGWFRGQLAAVFTMWEGSEIPPGFRENIPAFDRIFVPSEQCGELYSRWNDNVIKVPLGVDSKWRWRDHPVTGKFTFLTQGAGPRKNCETVVRAFHKVFGDGSKYDAQLVWRGNDAVPSPGVVAISSVLSPAEELEMYGRANCFVSGSRAEGWGLMPHQAIAQGLPTILGNAHGHAEFAHYGIGLDTHPMPSRPGTFFGQNGEWWDPDFQQMCESMRAVYDNYTTYLEAAAANSEMIHAEFSWQRTAEQLIYNLPELWEEDPVGMEWVTPPARRYHVRVTRDISYRINGEAFVYVPGEDYWEVADMKMRLGDSGALDPSVIDPHEMGVEEAKLAHKTAGESTCPTCHQLINSNLPPLVGV